MGLPQGPPRQRPSNHRCVCRKGGQAECTGGEGPRRVAQACRNRGPLPDRASQGREMQRFLDIRLDAVLGGSRWWGVGQVFSIKEHRTLRTPRL